MKTRRQKNYFRIGSFVIAGLAIMVLIILFIGSKALFQRTVYVETYFNESVQGLTEGSPVKYLGMDIGYVKAIMPIDAVYSIDRTKLKKDQGRYVYVLMAIYPKFFQDLAHKNVQQTLNNAIAAGLRVQIALQNVTGSIYLEVDFFNSKSAPLLPTYWTPKNYYIPSTPSTLTFVRDQALLLLNELKQVKFKKLFASMQTFADSANGVTNKMNNLLTHTDKQLIETIDNLHNMSRNLNALSEQAKNFPSSTLFGKPPPKLDPSKL